MVDSSLDITISNFIYNLTNNMITKQLIDSTEAKIYLDLYLRNISFGSFIAYVEDLESILTLHTGK
jgi:hypothetical protein